MSDNTLLSNNILTIEIGDLLMIFNRLFKQQEQIEKMVLDNICNDRTRICIYGRSGCGKTD